MLSANTLLSKNASNVKDNVPMNNRDRMYNPDIPKIGDKNLQSNDARSIKMKDRYYVDMALSSQVKNGDYFTLGQNNKGFTTFNDYDRSIDPNMMIRRDPLTKQYYQPNDFYNGSYDAYYSLPKTTRRPAPTIGSDMLSAISTMYDLKPSQISSGFLGNVTAGLTSGAGASSSSSLDTSTTSVSIPAPVNPPSGIFDYEPKRKTMVTPDVVTDTPPLRTPMKMTNLNIVGFDPTEDPDITRAKDEYDKLMMDSNLERNAGRQEKDTVYKRYGLDTKTDQYGNPVIRAPMRIGLDDVSGKFKPISV